MNKKGFTLIELLIVIAIISILVGVAVPYYNDYIYDARLSVLQQNLATIRKVLNQFRGDNGRGPFRATVHNSGAPIHITWHSTGDSELIAGPIQDVDGTITRRSNLQYLSGWPPLVNPRNGEQIPPDTWTPIPGEAVFYDADGDSIFDIDTEFAFANGKAAGNTAYDSAFDAVIHNTTGNPDSFYENGANQINATSLDYINFTVTIDGIDY